MARIARLLAGSVRCMSAWSTLTLAASLVDRPVVALGFDGWDEILYAISGRAGADYARIAKLQSFSRVRVAKSFDELERHINDYVFNPAFDQAGRARAVAQECGLQDGHATDRVTAALLKLSQDYQ